MRRDMDEDIRWGRLFLRVIIAFIVIILIIWLISKVFVGGNSKKNTKDEFSENLNELFSASETYFEDESKLPENNKSVVVTLDELIELDLIDKLKDGNTVCSNKSSYGKVTNKNGVYTLKALLTCGSNSDYKSKVIKEVEINNTEDNNEEEDNKNTEPANNTNNTTDTSNNNNTNNNTNNNISSPVVYEEEVVVDYTTMDYKYCKIVTNDYYVVVYNELDTLVDGYSTKYSVKLTDITNPYKLTLQDNSYFTNKTYYDKAKSMEDNFELENASSAKSVLPSTNTFIRASLKSTNFEYKLSDIYEKDGAYYIDVEYNVIKKYYVYYPSNQKKIDFIPVYFQVSYGDLNNCVTDTYKNSSKYSSYYIVK